VTGIPLLERRSIRQSVDVRSSRRSEGERWIGWYCLGDEMQLLGFSDLAERGIFTLVFSVARLPEQSASEISVGRRIAAAPFAF